MAVDSKLRRAAGRKLKSSDFTTRHLSGRSVRVLAFGLAFLPLSKPDDDTGTSRGEIPSVAILPLKIKG
jgi:hypothetical protein